jgi:hypothetical protein
LQDAVLPPIEDYSGLVLNEKAYFDSILKKVKIFECRIKPYTKDLKRIIFHPNKDIRETEGYTQNIEAEIKQHEHDKTIKSAADLLKATNDGQDLGMTKDQTEAFVREAKKKSNKCTFYLYSLKNPRKSTIQWFDHPQLNQMFMSKHQQLFQGKFVTLFAYPPQQVLYFPSIFYLLLLTFLFTFSGSCSGSTCLRLTSNWPPCPSATASDLPFPNGLHSHQLASGLTGGN